MLKRTNEEGRQSLWDSQDLNSPGKRRRTPGEQSATINYCDTGTPLWPSDVITTKETRKIEEVHRNVLINKQEALWASSIRTNI